MNCSVFWWSWNRIRPPRKRTRKPLTPFWKGLAKKDLSKISHIKKNQVINDLEKESEDNLKRVGKTFAGVAGLKRSNLEGGVRIPLVFYGPGIVPSGKRSDALVANYDFLPTMAEWLKLGDMRQKDGRSFLSQLLKEKTESAHSYIVFGSNTGPAIVTADGWKLRYYLSRNTIELFFLPDDPQELNDLSTIHVDKVSELKSLLLKECGGNLRNGVNKAG